MLARSSAVLARRSIRRFTTTTALPSSLTKACNTLRTKITPERVNLFIHAGNLLAIGAMFSPDMLYLRSFMIGASGCGIVFNLLQPSPLTAPALWGAFFICGHSVQIARLLHQPNVVMSERDHELYEHAFLPYGFSPRTFQTLMEEGDVVWATYEDGATICLEGSPVEYVQIILSGGAVFTHQANEKISQSRVARVIDSKAVASHRGTWVGEAFDPQFLEHSTHGFTIKAVGETMSVKFNLKKFHKVIDGDEAAVAAAEQLQVSTRARAKPVSSKLTVRTQPTHTTHAHTG